LREGERGGADGFFEGIERNSKTIFKNNF